MTPTAPPAAAHPPLEWRVHLARAQPRRLPWLALALLGVGGAAYWLFRSLPLALLAAGALTSATAEFLLPIRYRLTDELAECRNGLSLRRLRWTDVRRACLLDDGIYLSPLPRPSRLDAYRGLFLRCDGNREEVIAAVRRWRTSTTDRPEGTRRPIAQRAPDDRPDSVPAVVGRRVPSGRSVVEP